MKSSLSTEKFYIRFLSRPRGTMFFNKVFFKNGNRFAADVQFIVSRNSHGYIAFVKYQAWRMHFHNAVLDRVRERERERGKDGWMDGWVDRERERDDAHHSLDILWNRPGFFSWPAHFVSVNFSLQPPWPKKVRAVAFFCASLVVDCAFAGINSLVLRFPAKQK